VTPREALWKLVTSKTKIAASIAQAGQVEAARDFKSGFAWGFAAGSAAWGGGQ
jgi:hypothetical protein